MPGERPKLSMSDRCWERRIGDRLDAWIRAIDPVKELTSRLLPNDHHEARPRLAPWPATSDRSLVRPFTPPRGLRLPTGGC